MKSIKGVILVVILASSSLMAEHVAGYIECKYKDGGINDYVRFIVTGSGSGDDLAMANFLNAKYSSAIKKYCEQNKVYAHNGELFSFKTKSKANSEFSNLVSESNDASYIKKTITISHGYREKDWR